MKTKLKIIPGVLWGFLGFVFLCSPVGELQAQVDLAALLSDRALWGKDFNQVLSRTQVWQRIDEPTMVIFPTVVTGAALYEEENVAGRQAELLRNAFKERPPKFQRQFKKPLTRAAALPLTFDVRAVQLPRDAAVQVRLEGEDLQFLPAELTLAQVKSKYGEPEKTTEALTNEGRGHRPIVLTQYHYAGGAVKFVTMDWDPVPDRINRVLLDVQQVSRVIYR